MSKIKRKMGGRTIEELREMNRRNNEKHRIKMKSIMQAGTRYCRVCQTNETKVKFDKIFDPNLKIAADLYYLASLVIFETSDQHPALICKSCQTQLNRAIAFKKKILQSEKLFKKKYAHSARGLKYLRKLFEKSADDAAALEIKQEPIDSEDDEEPFNETPLTTENVMEEENEFRPTEVLLLPAHEIKQESNVIEQESEQKSTGALLAKVYAKFQFACDVEGCKRSFREEYKLNLHKKAHSPESFECPVCQRVFIKENKFVQHLEYHKAKARMAFSCDICGKKFAFKTKVRRHMEIHLPPDEQFICHVCAKIFRTRTNLKNHCRTHVEKTIQCDQCPARFNNSYKLKRHMATHSNKKMFACSECPDSFMRKIELTDHEKKVHEIEEKHAETILFKCNQCEESFKFHRLLRIHQALEHDNAQNELKIPKGKLKHKCKFCARNFNFKHQVKDHMQKFHPDQLQFNCTECETKFLDKNDLDEHMKRKHTEEIFFGCFSCEEKFPTRKGLDGHLKRTHGIEILEDTLGTQHKTEDEEIGELLNEFV